MITYWILFAILFGAVVFIHELGHFLVAKWSGVFVERFALGFGPALVKKKWGETEYAICALPLGGYVKMRGEEPEEEKKSENTGPDPRSFADKHPLIRVAIAAMGPTANLILPVILFTGMFMVGVSTVSSHIGYVLPDHPAAKAGLQSGDKIVSVQGQVVSKWGDVEKAISRRPDVETKIDIERNGQLRSILVKPKREVAKTPLGDEKEVGKIGIDWRSFRPSVGVSNPNSPAAKAGIHTGDVIVSVNGQKTEHWWQVDQAFSATKQTQEITIERLYEPALRVSDSSLAAKADLKTGDAIVAVNGQNVTSWCEFDRAFSNSKTAQKIDVQRLSGKDNATVSSLSVTLPRIVKTLADAGIGRKPQGLKRTETISLRSKTFKNSGIENGEFFIRDVLPDGVACEKGLMAGDRLETFNKQPIASWFTFQKQIRDNSGDAVVLGVVRNNNPTSIELTPREDVEKHAITKQKQKVRRLGIIVAAEQSEPEEVIERYLNPFTAIGHAVQRTVEMSSLTIAGLARVFTGKIALSESVGGPITIFYIAGGSFEAGGWVGFLQMMAMLSITLGLINFLPIPVLDGGHIFFNLIEFAKGSPVSLRIREMAQQVGLVIILGLIILTFYVDINRYFVDRIKAFFN